MQGMIMHHAQAVEMTALIESHTENKDLRLLGARISLFDTYMGLILIYTASTLPFVIWMMLTFVTLGGIWLNDNALIGPWWFYVGFMALTAIHVIRLRPRVDELHVVTLARAAR